jgi:hypothetical protein
MSTRKRRCEILSAKPISSRCGPSASQEFGILHAATQFLEFRDCAKVDQLDKLFHVKLWLHVLNCATRQPRETINVNEQSALWLERFSDYLRNQSLILNLWSNKAAANYHKIFAALTIPQLYSLRVIDSSLRVIDSKRVITLPRKLHTLTVTHLAGTFNYGNVKQVILKGMVAPDSLRTLSNTVSKMTFYFPSLPFSTWPVLPNVTCLKLCFWRNQLDIDNIQAIFPALLKLFLFNRNNRIAISLEALRNARLLKLKIICDMLVDLEPLCSVALQELDVSDCPRIVDFSSVRHVPIVRKHQK